jgi:hypothetical protein
MTELACIGHWYTDLLYLVPVLVMAGFVGRDKLRSRKCERNDSRRVAVGSAPGRAVP